MSQRRLDAAALHDWADAAVAELIAHAEEINKLNVFPVADSDTGTNMLFTMRSALAEPSLGGDVAQAAASLAAGAAHGARGNSGVILAEILGALADVTAEAAADSDLTDVDAALLGAALRHAVARAVTAMGGEFVAGTVLSVLQSAADAVEHAAADGDGLAAALTAAGAAATAALERTPEQLPVLADAGVVDAGGRGLLALLDALTVTVTGHIPVRRGYPAAVPLAAPVGPGGAGGEIAAAAPEFEVMYLVDGRDPATVRRSGRGWRPWATRSRSPPPPTGGTRCMCTPTTPGRRSRRGWRPGR